MEKVDIYDIENEVFETQIEDGKIKITNNLYDYSKRAEKFKRIDRVTLEELNVALEYFDYRCAYTGQQFVTFDEKVSKSYRNNLSVDHIIALVSGGHNIAQNMIPSVLQYNISKNGYHLLDWYKMQETPSGEKIYSPYRLLKIYNYMAKSLSAMDLKGEEYRQAILSKNEIDNYLETKKEEIYSDEITTYEVDNDGTSLLQKIPNINGSIADLKEEQNLEYSQIELNEFMNNMLLELEGSIDKDILQNARDLFENLANREKVYERIPKEEKVQAEVIEYLKTLGCESSYTITRTINISKLIEQNILAEEYIKPKIVKIQKYLIDSNIHSLEIGTILDNIPQVIESDNISEAFLSLGIEVPENMAELQRLGLDVGDKDVRNINTALQIVNEYNFEESIERKITDDEKKILVGKILNSNRLDVRAGSYISTLYKNLIEKGMATQEAYGAIINYAIGYNGNYGNALGSVKKIQEVIRTSINIEDINQILMSNGIILQEDKKQIEKLGLDVGDKDVRNINTALKIINEYNFEENIGRKITEEEKKIILEKLLSPSSLNKNAHVFLSTLCKNLTEKRMTTQEAYGAIINYALGYNGNYAHAIIYFKNIREYIKSDVSEEKINKLLMDNGVVLKNDEKQIEELRLDVGDKDVRNINFALKIINEYSFEESIGRKITDEEKKILVEKILKPSGLNNRKKPTYISTLYKNLKEKGMATQEAYGAIINYALGNNGGYYGAIASKKKIQENLKVEISESDINVIHLNNKKRDFNKNKQGGINKNKEVSYSKKLTDENIQLIEELGLDVGDKDVRNINTALKIINEYNFEESIGRKITEEEKKILIENILAPTMLNCSKGRYLSTLCKNLKEKGMATQEVYGAIINYAIGNNGGYAKSLDSVNKIQEDIKTEVSINDITYMLMNKGNVSEEYKSQIEELGLDVWDKNTRNINAALKIVNEYDFEGSIGRKITAEEKKKLIESILAPVALDSINKKYISTLYKNLAERGMDIQEAYGAIINYAMGNNGSYAYAIANKKGTKENLKVEISESDINVIDLDNRKRNFNKNKQVPVNWDNEAIYSKKLTDKNIQLIEELGLDVGDKDVRNINFALKIVNEYNFDESIGRKITEEEKKIIVEKILNPSGLNNGKKPKYLSTLYKNLTEKGMSTQEVYGAIINYAMGNNGNYTLALGSGNKIQENIKTDVSTDDITYVSMNKGTISEEYKKQIEELGLNVEDKDARNTNFALKIINEYNFEYSIGRKITAEEKKIIVEKILSSGEISRGRRYLSTLYTNLINKGTDVNSAYGIIINYALGNNGSYAHAIANKKGTKENLKSLITPEDLDKVMMENGTILATDKKELDELEIDATKKDIQNINTALKIVNEYDFKENIGREITNREKKILVETILNQSCLDKRKGTCYLSTLHRNLVADKKMDIQEAYGTIINYAIGNNKGYNRAITSAKHISEKSKLKTYVSEEDITYMLINNENISEEYKSQMEELGLDVGDKDVRNINTALKIVNEYNFEESIGRKITAEEKKIIVEVILSPKSLNCDGTGHIPTLYRNLVDSRKMDNMEAYGAIINYAIGNNGGYDDAINSKSKMSEKHELKISVNEEDIEKAKNSVKRKIKKSTKLMDCDLTLTQKAEMKQQKLEAVKELKESVKKAEELYEQTSRTLLDIEKEDKGIEML